MMVRYYSPHFLIVLIVSCIFIIVRVGCKDKEVVMAEQIEKVKEIQGINKENEAHNSNILCFIVVHIISQFLSFLELKRRVQL